MEIEEDSWEAEFEDELADECSCDYDVCELCEEPQTKAMGLCTTECSAYLNACEKENEALERERYEH